jgi:predicted transcriptional regulator
MMKATGMLWLGAVLLFLGVLGMVLGLAFLVDVGRPGEKMTYGTAFCTLGLGLAFAVAGGALLTTGLRARRREREEAIEAEVLRVALSRDGRITAAEVAMATELSLEEAQKYLERLARSGTISVEVGANGMLIYSFGATSR